MANDCCYEPEPAKISVTLSPADILALAQAIGLAVAANDVNPPDVEWEELCDVQADGTVVEFWSRTVTTFNVAGAITGTVVNNFKVDRVTPYTTTGAVRFCDDEECNATPLGVVQSWG
jgi:hypothetical protein